MANRTELPNGFCLYWEDNKVGGRVYWSDEIGNGEFGYKGGVFVWDTSLVDKSTLLAAVCNEERLYRQEDYEKRLKKEWVLEKGKEDEKEIA